MMIKVDSDLAEISSYSHEYITNTIGLKSYENYKNNLADN